MVVRLLATLGEVESDVEAEQLAAFSQGSLQRAKQFGEPDLRAFRDEFLTRLGQLPSASVALAADLGKFVESGKKDAPIRRERLKLVVLVAIEFYRAMIRQLNGLSPTGDSGLQAFIGDDLRAQNVDPETVAACIERCLDAQSQVEANANQATLIECWIDDLARLFQSAYA